MGNRTLRNVALGALLFAADACSHKRFECATIRETFWDALRVTLVLKMCGLLMRTLTRTRSLRTSATTPIPRLSSAVSSLSPANCGRLFSAIEPLSSSRLCLIYKVSRPRSAVFLLPPAHPTLDKDFYTFAVPTANKI